MKNYFKFLFLLTLTLSMFSCEPEIDSRFLPVVTTTEVSNISEFSAKSGGEITGDGGYDLIEAGICWSTSPNPTIDGSKTKHQAKLGAYTSSIDSLTPNTTYFVRAYATNKKGVAYGSEVSFSTFPISVPVVTTLSIKEITRSTAVSGGDISHDGGSSITEKGVCWSTSPNPSISDNKTNDGAGIDAYASLIEELEMGTIYYLKAYAKNGVGTGYGEELSFKTHSLASVSTIEVTSISATFARSGGTIADNGGTSIIEKGICWSTIPNPTIEDNKTSQGEGDESYTSIAYGLERSTTYYVRAYATNLVGTSYGNELSFETMDYGDVYNPVTGKIWMDRNLGASRVATSSTDVEAYGDLYQWGRGSDGHEKRTSGSTTRYSETDSPGHAAFICPTLHKSIFYDDWRTPPNDNLWQGVDGINNPCPEGYRVPTTSEWSAELASWSTKNAAGAMESPLKLPMGGERFFSWGTIWGEGTTGFYWSSYPNYYNANLLYFHGDGASVVAKERSWGGCVRCIKDEQANEN